MPIPAFAASLFEYDDASSLKLSGGNRFIRKLPDDRSLGYLHKLYTPLAAAGIKRTGDAVGRPLPKEFESFLGWSNGASLFDNQLYIFGLVKDFSRNIDPKAQQPISIVESNRVFSEVESDRWHGGWTRIGSAVGWESRYELQLHKEGTCALSSDSGSRAFSSFGTCMATLIDRFSGCFSCDGIIDRSYAELEAALLSLIRHH